ncbi:unnamed protein product [Durusdinium trenchii]
MDAKEASAGARNGWVSKALLVKTCLFGFVAASLALFSTTASSPLPDVTDGGARRLGAAGLAPLLGDGSAVDWWFAFKLTTSAFPTCSAKPTCAFGGKEQTDGKYGLQYVLSYGSKGKTNAMQLHTDCLGNADDPLAKTFNQVYSGQAPNFVVWNDQFYGDPVLNTKPKCTRECEAPWGHSKGVLAWGDDGTGFVLQVTTPDWPGAGVVPASHRAVDVLDLAEERGLLQRDEAQGYAKRWLSGEVMTDDDSATPLALQRAVLLRASLYQKRAAAKALAELSGLYLCELRPLDTRSDRAQLCASKLPFSALWGQEDGLFVGGAGSGKGLHVDQRPESNVGKQWQGRKLFAAWPIDQSGSWEECYGELFAEPLEAKHLKALEESTQLILLEPGDLFIFNGQMPHTALCLAGDLNVTSYEGFLSLHPEHLRQFQSVCNQFLGPWQPLAEEWKQELHGQLCELQEAWHTSQKLLSQDGDRPLPGLDERLIAAFVVLEEGAQCCVTTEEGGEGDEGELHGEEEPAAPALKRRKTKKGRVPGPGSAVRSSPWKGTEQV